MLRSEQGPKSLPPPPLRELRPEGTWERSDEALSRVKGRQRQWGLGRRPVNTQQLSSPRGTGPRSSQIEGELVKLSPGAQRRVPEQQPGPPPCRYPRGQRGPRPAPGRPRPPRRVPGPVVSPASETDTRPHPTCPLSSETVQESPAGPGLTSLLTWAHGSFTISYGVLSSNHLPGRTRGTAP